MAGATRPAQQLCDEAGATCPAVMQGQHTLAAMDEAGAKRWAVMKQGQQTQQLCDEAGAILPSF